MTPQSRRRFLQMAGAASVAPLGCAPRKAAPPNILYIIVDDLGFDLGCYGGTQIQTPNLDRLAAEGMRFTEAYSGCSVCAPARSTLMTGTHMGHTPVRRNSGGVSLTGNFTTVASLLSANGYRCGGFGKWGLGDLDTPGVPEKQGFERFFGYYHQVHAHYFYPEYLIDTGRKAGLPENRGAYGPEGPKAPQQPFPGKNPLTGETLTFSHYRIVEEMKNFVRDSRGGPFFCYAPWTPPHGRFEIPESDPAWDLYKDKPWSMQARIYAAYATMVDRHAGEVLDLLKELDLDDNTAVFFSSDNGAADQYPGELDSAGVFRGQKTTMYEGGLRLPFLARWPGRIAPGSQSDLPIYFPDFLPTAAAIAGIEPEVPQAIDGISILPELTGAEKLLRERPMYWEWNQGHFAPYEVHMQAHRNGKWKIVRHGAANPWELYDLSEDPSEKNDLAAAHPDIVARMDAWVARNRVDPPEQVEPEKPDGQRWR
ncbi:MAG: arylsulfatase [Bryobacteraceae bacterium]|nr:arylsulfatase [Bryobacteraceae bacterium]